MFQSPILDVAVGLVLFFLVLSLVCTSLNEFVAQALNLRQEVLWRGLCSLFQNSDDTKAEEIARKILDHNLVDAMSPPGSNPTSIPAHVFSLAVLDVIGIDGSSTGTKISSLLTIARTKRSTDLGDNVFATLMPLAVAADTSVDQFRLNIEKWFNDTMDRASGWYKKQMRTITFFVAFAICLMVNADAIMLAKALWTSPQAAAKLVSTAQTVSKLNPPTDVSKSANVDSGNVAKTATTPESDVKLLPPELQTSRSEIMGLIGWSGSFPWQPGYSRTNEHRYPVDFWEGVLKLIGLLVTTIAACLGAPFWFDALSKIISLRGGNTNSTDNQTRIPSPGKTEGQPS